MRLHVFLFYILLINACLSFVIAWTTTTSPFTTSRCYPSSTTLFNKKASKKKKKTSGGGTGFGTTTTTKETTFAYAGSVQPGVQSPQRVVVQQGTLIPPDYAQTGIPSTSGGLQLPWMIQVKTAQEIAKMRASGALARQVLDKAGRAVAVGVTTDEIDTIVHEEIVKNGAYPSPLNYHGFPKSCCTSVNEVICHGIPDSRPLQAGDIINIDITVYLDGFHGDCSEMFVVGKDDVDESTRNLLQTTYDCWIAACQFVQVGRDYKDIGAIIEDYVTPRGFSSVRQFCGHGIGRTFHTNPNILHYRNNEPNGSMAAGHTFTIEPMICERSAKALSWPDGWTATTVDGKRSAQFEHTLLISESGVEALTGKTKDSPLQFWEANSEFHRGIWLGTSLEAVAKQDAINAKLLGEQRQ